MSGGSQHNPNGRQSQLGPGWSPLQVANFLARAPQVHMASDRGVTWHTPTPPPHLYHVPAPSPPDPLQAMKNAGANSVFRHTATPPELYRHTPTPPDKHLMRHTPSPGDVKTGVPMQQAELYPHLGPGRDKLRPEDLLAYARVGVDLSLAGARAANGSPAPHAAPHAASPALSVRDAPTINSLIARAQPRHGHARVDALLERLVPSPASPHSVIVHPRPAASPSPSPPSSNEDSADSCGAPPGSKRKRKPERTIRVPTIPPPAPPSPPHPPHPPRVAPPVHLHKEVPPEPPAATPTPATALVPAHLPPPVHPPPVHPPSPVHAPPLVPPPQPVPPSVVHPPSPVHQQPQVHQSPKPIENGEVKTNGPEKPLPSPPQQTDRPARRKTRSGSAETIDDIAAMIASTDRPPGEDQIISPLQPTTPTEPLVTVDNLKSVLASPEPKVEPESHESPSHIAERPASPPPPSAPPAPPAPTAPVAPAVPSRRRSTRASNSESANVPAQSPSEAKPAEAGPAPASFVEVEDQLEKMFAGIEEEPLAADKAGDQDTPQTAKAKKRRKSAPTKGERKAGRRASRASTDEGGLRRKAARKKEAGRAKKKEARDAYDSGSNASSGRSRGPYIQIRGPRDSPLSVSVINASTGEEEGEAAQARRKGAGAGCAQFRNGLRARGLHASTLGLRYDATTPDATWLCAFCERGPHAAGLGDLFGPYAVSTELTSPESKAEPLLAKLLKSVCVSFRHSTTVKRLIPLIVDRALDEATRRRYTTGPNAGTSEVWFHASCGVWAPGLVAAGARVWGLAAAVWGARAGRCGGCPRPGAPLACAARLCRARVHFPCAVAADWRLDEDTFRALCPRHATEQ